MIKFSAKNVLVHSISPVLSIPSRNGGQDFLKRELIIDDSWDKDGKHYSNFVLIEFSGERMNALDSCYPGQRVNVEGMLTGREYNNRIFNTVRGTSIYPAQLQQQATAPAPMPGYPQQQPAPQYTQQPAPGYPQPAAPAYPQQQAPQPMPQSQYPSSPVPAQQPYSAPGAPGVDNLPFPTR